MTEDTIFATALEKADVAERTAFLKDACGPDAELLRRLESLLAAHDRAGSFLKKSPVEPPADRTSTLTGEGDDLDDALEFLVPSEKPGSIGRIDHYEILELLGRGGFGIVFRAYDETLQRVVAVKVLSPSMAATSPARKRFLREARSSAAVRHENVVQVHAVEEQPLPYLVMEFIPGETLQKRIDRTGPLDIRDILRIGRQLAEGLAAAHATGLIHRDIKPSNVLIGPDDRVKITDFGLARAADDASLTRSGVVAGTPLYMAPEQAKGDTLDHRADLFSLGSVLYVMATGRPPFRASNTFAVMKRVAEEQPRPMREIIPEVPDWFCRVVEKLHAKSPAERFQTSREVADVLADCERQMTAHAGVKDFKRIPPVRIAPARRARFLSTLAAVIPCVAIALLWVGPFGVRYARGVGVVEFRTDVDFDVEKLVVRETDEGPVVATLDRANPRQSIPPANYVIEAVGLPGYDVSKFRVETSRLLTYVGTFDRVADRPTIRLDVRRGDFSSVAAMTGRRVVPPETLPHAAAVGSLEELVAAATKGREWAREQFDAGLINEGTMIAAEIDLIEAKVKLAEAKRDRDGLLKRLEELVRQTQAERDFVAARVEAGQVAVTELSAAEIRLAEAKIRLARAKAATPE